MKRNGLMIIISAIIISLPIKAVEQKCVEIDAPLLKLFDGIINFVPIMLTNNKLRHLQSGEGVAKKGLINLGNQKVTVKHMLTVDAHNEFVKQAHKQTIEMIRDINKKYSSDLTKYKGSIVGILQQWANQRNMSNSILLKWSNVSDDVFFKQYLGSFQGIDQFIDEFSLFIRDVKCTCKKSSQIFDEVLKQVRSGAKKEL